MNSILYPLLGGLPQSPGPGLLLGSPDFVTHFMLLRIVLGGCQRRRHQCRESGHFSLFYLFKHYETISPSGDRMIPLEVLHFQGPCLDCTAENDSSSFARPVYLEGRTRTEHQPCSPALHEPDGRLSYHFLLLGCAAFILEKVIQHEELIRKGNYVMFTPFLPSVIYFTGPSQNISNRSGLRMSTAMVVAPLGVPTAL